MALTNDTPPLQIAMGLLDHETIKIVTSHPKVTGYGYSILDRWSLNQPDELLKLSRQSKAGLVIQLINQQEMEKKALAGNSAYQMSLQGYTQWEILESLGINTAMPKWS